MGETVLMMPGPKRQEKSLFIYMGLGNELP